MSASLNVVKTDRLIANIPSTTLEKHNQYSVKKPWIGKFEVSLWLNFPRGLCKDISLQIRYRDKDKLKSIQIDQCSGNAQREILLNGCPTISASGSIKAAGLFIKGLEKNEIVKVGEFRVIPKTEEPSKDFSRATRNIKTNDFKEYMNSTIFK